MDDKEFSSLKSKISNKNLTFSSNFELLANKIKPANSSKASMRPFLSVSQIENYFSGLLRLVKIDLNSLKLMA